jgi:hypothetical protein
MRQNRHKTCDVDENYVQLARPILPPDSTWQELPRVPRRNYTNWYNRTRVLAKNSARFDRVYPSNLISIRRKIVLCVLAVLVCGSFRACGLAS